jgi:flagellar basal body-associated protein FliL
MEKSTRRTWISIVIASVIIVGILAVAAVGGTAYFFYRHINAQYAPRESADEQFAAARARFSGQKPLIEIRRR